MTVNELLDLNYRYLAAQRDFPGLSHAGHEPKPVDEYRLQPSLAVVYSGHLHMIADAAFREFNRSNWQ